MTTKSIKARAKITFQINEKLWYSFEFEEERTIKPYQTDNMELERKKLWDIVNSEVENQIYETQKSYGLIKTKENEN